ncbi:hypothetical protein [Actinotalea sp.]|uniref:hypothetical protein n=1 Tax=Actinotalea sp. TaxID=1872145 RepID=UPI00356635C0
MSNRPDERGLLLRLGLPRDPAGPSQVAGFLVSAVVTVMLTRALLAATGYPQLGGDGLHVAHVLWGGLLMALGFVVLVSFVGPAVRPVGALLGGIGFGLFVDEIGKFVTADNDYFYAPTAALIYVVVVVLVLLAEALHGRTPHRPAEYLAAAADHAVSGLAGGFTPRTRAQAHRLLERGRGEHGAAQVEALLAAVDDDPSEVPNPISAVSSWVVRTAERLVTARFVPQVTVGVLLLTAASTVLRGLMAWDQGADLGWWVIGGVLGGALTTTVLAVRGLLVVRTDRHRGYVLFRRAVLVSLLLTQVFVFRLEQWAAVSGLVVDLLVLLLVAAELDQIEQADVGPVRGVRGVRGAARED